MLKRKKEIFVKKEIIPPHLQDPMKKSKTFKQTKFDRFDIPGETIKAVRTLLFVAFALFLLWFLYRNILAWNIFQP